MKSLSICAGLVALAISFASSDPILAANTNGPRILVIDRKVLIQGSKLGQNIQQQLMAYSQKMQGEFGPEGQALENEQQGLDKLAFQAKQTAFQKKIQERQNLIRGGQMAARKYFTDQIDAVVHAIMSERGAEAVLDKNTVVASMNGADVTKEAVQRLDKKSPSFKVPLVKPSMQDMLQMQSGMPQGQ